MSVILWGLKDWLTMFLFIYFIYNLVQFINLYKENGEYKRYLTKASISIIIVFWYLMDALFFLK